MKKLLLILFCLPIIFSSCLSEKQEENKVLYNKEEELLFKQKEEEKQRLQEERGWTPAMRHIFLLNCSDTKDIDVSLFTLDYCGCLLEEVMEKYTVEESELLTTEDYINFETFEECAKLIQVLN